jgi:hypothetical protein
VPPALQQPNAPATASPSAVPVQAEASSEDSLASSISDDSWKAEYEAHEKAEKERLKWEAIRAIEREEAAKRRAAGFIDEHVANAVGPSKTTSEMWESVGEISAATTAASSTPAELVDLDPSVSIMFLAGHVS